jgi:transcription elongation GreA/GreB family factor
LVAELEARRTTLMAAQKTSSEGVTHADAQSDGGKDMRSTEASYIARGQAQRVDALDADLARVRSLRIRAFDGRSPVALSALVQLLDGDGQSRVVFIAPAGGGVRLSQAGASVQVVTPASPLGRALLGAALGDDVVVEGAGATQEYELAAIA